MTTYHCILTLQWLGDGPGAGTIVTRTEQGTFPLAPGAARGDVVAVMRGRVGIPPGCRGEGAILFFSLEPAQLGPAA